MVAKRFPGWIGRGLDVLWLVALALYALAGYRNVPFHGDEATIITMSSDYHALFQSGDLDAVMYSDTPDDPAMQELRYVNGSVSKLAIGLAWDLAGYTVEDLNQPWEWGAPWDWNIRDGHMPRDALLYVARLSSALLLAASAWAVFAIGWIVGGGRWAAYGASLVYILTPAVLINGRRAMFEGALLLSSALVVLAALFWLRAGRGDRVRWWHVAMFGLACAVALSSKHTTAIVVAIAFAVIGMTAVVQRRGDLLRLGGALLLAGVVFLLLNPVWWSDPWNMPGRVVDERQELVRGQRDAYGTYDGIDDRLAGLILRAADGEPQYFELPVWRVWIGDRIAAYEGHAWTGIDGGVIGTFVRLVGIMFGTAVLLDRALAPRRDPAARLALAWFWGTALVLFALTPFDWQRYYLPLQPALAVVIGAAVAWIAARIGLGEMQGTQRV